MAFELKKVLKALLFSSSQALSVKDVQTAIARFHDMAAPAPAAAEATGPAPAEAGLPPGEEPAEVPGEAFEDSDLYRDVPMLVTSAQIREAMEQIALELRAADDGLVLVEGASGWRFATHPRFARWVRILRQEPAPARLSASSLETLAVVAYRQPVTRTEIEAVRGVSAEAGLARLMERELVVITGRADLPGRPLQYGTTEKLLEFLGVRSLDELPASDVLSTRQIDEWLRDATSPRHLGDASVGLEEELPLQAAPAAPAGADHPSAGDEPRAAS